MHAASLALGFGLGVLSVLVLLVPVAAALFGVAMRWAMAFERSGIDITIRSPDGKAGA